MSLAGVRVVEVAELVAGPYATKLLADLGAQVIKVEPPGGDRARHMGPFGPDAPGDPDRSGLFLGLNTNKSNLVIDLDAAAGRRRLAELVAQADIVVHDLTPSRATAVGLDPKGLLAADPSLVVCAITPYGSTGPHAEWAGSELTVVHGGGWGYLIPGDAPDATTPPLTVPGWFAHHQAATAAAMAALAAHDKARSTGVGEYIDQSVMAHVSSMLEASFIAWSYRGQIPRRDEGRILTPWRILECADGLIFLVTVEQDQWERLVELMGTPDWTQIGIFDTVEDRAANQDVLNMYLEEWTRTHRVEDLWHQGQARRICFAPVFTMADLAGQPHLDERGFFHRIGGLTHLGPAARTEPSSWSLRTPAPTLAQADDGVEFGPRQAHRPAPDPAAITTRPLTGVRVIDFSWVWAGPFATLQLAQLGADVIKVESAARPSLARRLPIHPPDIEPTLDSCGYFNQWEQGKRSIELDLTAPAAVDTVLTLICAADVVIDNYATGVMDRLGLGDDVLWAANPDLVIASITGYGHTGPLREYMGYGPTTCPLSGLTSMTGHRGERPVEAGLSIGDPAAGLATAFAVVAALCDRDRSGGVRIDTSLWEATATNAAHAWMGQGLGAAAFEPDGSRHFAAAPHGVFPGAGDDAWVAIAAMDDVQWQGLAEVLGLVGDDRFATLADRKANEDVLEEALCRWTSTREPWAIAEQLQAVGVAAYPSLDVSQLELNPQHVARGFWERFDHPVVGRRTHSGVPWLTHNQPDGSPGRAPLLGEHSAEIRTEFGL